MDSAKGAPPLRKGQIASFFGFSWGADADSAARLHPARDSLTGNWPQGLALGL